MILFHKTINNNIVLHYDRKKWYIFYFVSMETDVILKSSLVLRECLGRKTFILRLHLYFSSQTYIFWYRLKEYDTYFSIFAFLLNSKQSNYNKVNNQQFQINGADDSTGDNSGWKLRKFSAWNLKFTLWTSFNQIFKSFCMIVYETLKFYEKSVIFRSHF